MSKTDRAAGALLGLATGDALGAGYEFQSDPLGDHGEAAMIGGGIGGFEPGEWTDDTSMAICIAEVTATGSRDLDAIGERFRDWYRSGPKDVGISTGAVLGGSSGGLHARADAYFADHPRGAAGNGSLMRTASVALATLREGEDETAAFAREVSHLTHGDPLAADACVLWSLAIRMAIENGHSPDIVMVVDVALERALKHIPVERRDRWAAWLEEARTFHYRTFSPNGFVVPALQAAYAAIRQTPVVGRYVPPPGSTSYPEEPWPEPGEPECLHLQRALHNAVRIGNDTDTVAAIAGSLLGAWWGSSAVPFRWKRMLDGWPGYDANDLVRLAVLSVAGGKPDASGWPSAPRLDGGPARSQPLPEDADLIVGNLGGLSGFEEGDLDAVVSLCRVGAEQAPPDVEHHQVHLIDQEGAEKNPNLLFVLADTADAIATLRREGRRVYLHCHGGASRAPTVLALYLARHRDVGLDDAFRRADEVAPFSWTNHTFRDAVADLVARHPEPAWGFVSPAARVCENCGSPRVTPVLYGYPGDDLMRAAAGGAISLGGCVLPEPGEGIVGICRACGHKRTETVGAP